MMLPQQKEALGTLICSILFTVLLALAVPLFGSYRSEAILVLFVLFIVTLWVVRKITKLTFKSLDEMDKTIRQQAAVIATHAMGATIALYAIGLYLASRSGIMIPAYLVLQMAMYSWLALYLCWSGSILILYRKGALHV